MPVVTQCDSRPQPCQFSRMLQGTALLQSGVGGSRAQRHDGPLQGSAVQHTAGQTHLSKLTGATSSTPIWASCLYVQHALKPRARECFPALLVQQRRALCHKREGCSGSSAAGACGLKGVKGTGEKDGPPLCSEEW